MLEKARAYVNPNKMKSPIRMKRDFDKNAENKMLSSLFPVSFPKTIH